MAIVSYICSIAVLSPGWRKPLGGGNPSRALQPSLKMLSQPEQQNDAVIVMWQTDRTL